MQQVSTGNTEGTPAHAMLLNLHIGVLCLQKLAWIATEPQKASSE